MTLQLYIARQILVGFAFAVGGMAFIAIPGVAVNAVHKLGGVGMATLLGYLPLVLTGLVPYLVPIGFLLAVVAVYGRLAADNEWTAICMAGFSPLRMLLPALAVAGVLALGTELLVSYVSPGLSYRTRVYLKDSVVQSLRTLSPGRTQLSFGDFYLNSRYRQGNEFRDVFIHVPAREEEGAQSILADRAVFEVRGNEMLVQLANARRVHTLQDTSLEYLQVTIDLDELFGTTMPVRNAWKYQTSRELRRTLARGEVPSEHLLEARFEIHNRHALASTSLLFLLLGAPTGLLLRHGTQLGALATAIAYALAYYVLSMRLGKTLGVSGAMPQWLAAWSTTILGAAAGIVLAWKAMRR